jgi:hypothetical protein
MVAVADFEYRWAEGRKTPAPPRKFSRPLWPEPRSSTYENTALARTIASVKCWGRARESLRGRAARVVGVFGVANLACDLDDVPSCGSRAPRRVATRDLSSILSLLWPLLLAFTLPQLVFFRFYAWGIRHSFDQCD